MKSYITDQPTNLQNPAKMYFSITTLAALACASSLSSFALAATTHNTRRQTPDPHVVDFRTFGAPGCFAENQGVYTYEQSDVGTCFPFGTLPVESLFVTDITDGCYGEFFFSSFFFQ